MRRAILLLAFMLAVAAAAQAAGADTPAIADDGQPAWTGGVDRVSPLEAALSAWASQRLGKSVSVRCDSSQEFASNFLSVPNNNTGATSVDSPDGSPLVWGFTLFTGGVPASYTEVRQEVCDALQQFAVASAKPTKCPVPHEETTTEPQALTEIRYVIVKVRQKRHGRWATMKQRRRRLVTVTRQVPVTKTVTEPGPCYGDGHAAADMPDNFWRSYFFTAASLETVAHETQRLYGVADSMVANCHAVQTIASLAEHLGDTPDDAEAIATYDYDVIYQGRAHDDGYWSPDCRDGGALDLNPGSSVWP